MGRMVVPCEVYSRVVGYYRPVQAWNIGKQQEFRERSVYDKTVKTTPIAEVDDGNQDRVS